MIMKTILSLNNQLEYIKKQYFTISSIFYFDEDVQIAVFRDNHQLFAVSNICPHQYAAVICNGFLEEKTVTCPLHGWIYSLESGKALGSNARLLTYHIFEDEGLVWLEQPKKTRPLWLENF